MSKRPATNHPSVPESDKASRFFGDLTRKGVRWYLFPLAMLGLEGKVEQGHAAVCKASYEQFAKQAVGRPRLTSIIAFILEDTALVLAAEEYPQVSPYDLLLALDPKAMTVVGHTDIALPAHYAKGADSVYAAYSLTTFLAHNTSSMPRNRNCVLLAAALNRHGIVTAMSPLCCCSGEALDRSEPEPIRKVLIDAGILTEDDVLNNQSTHAGAPMGSVQATDRAQAGQRGPTHSFSPDIPH